VEQGLRIGRRADSRAHRGLRSPFGLTDRQSGPRSVWSN
jgi:hypothetical protein